MAGNRKKAEEFIMALVTDITRDPRNAALYKNTVFPAMNDKQFEQWLQDLKDHKIYLGLVVPHGEISLSVERNLAIGKKLGFNFFQKLWMGKQGSRPAYLTNPEYMIIDVPDRRASQRQEKKISVPKNTSVTDVFTGQVTGDSKGAAMSAPEVTLLGGMGLIASSTEVMKYRGGDKKGMAALNASIAKTGTARLAQLEQFQSGVESKRMFKNILTARHLRNTL